MMKVANLIAKVMRIFKTIGRKNSVRFEVARRPCPAVFSMKYHQVLQEKLNSY